MLPPNLPTEIRSSVDMGWAGPTGTLDCGPCMANHSRYPSFILRECLGLTVLIVDQLSDTTVITMAEQGNESTDLFKCCDVNVSNSTCPSK